MKKRIRLTESDLHNIIKKSVNKILVKENLNNNKRELEDAIRNVLGVLNNCNRDDFDCLDNGEIENLYDTLNNTLRKINDSYDYGPYEDDPYYFGY